MKSRLLFLALFILLISSCGISNSASRSDSNQYFRIGKTSHITNYEVIQTLDKDFGLAMNRNTLMVIAIRTSDKFYPVYDGEIISGAVVMTTTYTYETREDEHGRSRMKTVPVVIPLSEYKGGKR